MTLHSGSKLKRANTHAKRAVPRHSTLSRASAARLERQFEKTIRREGRAAVREGLEEVLFKSAPAIAEAMVERAMAAAPLLQRIHDLAEDARQHVWCSDDPSDASEALDDLIALALKAGATPRDRNYP